MGLDMYLTRKLFIGAQYDHRKITGRVSLKIEGEIIPIKLKSITEITQDVAYWRKANHIHKWFVENCQGGIDECQTTEITEKNIIELLSLCRQVADNHELAEELLPVQSGFFFGGTTYNEYYFSDIDDTIKMLEKLMEEDKKYSSGLYTSYEYHASW